MKNIGHELMSLAKTEKKLTYSIRTIEFNKKKKSRRINNHESTTEPTDGIRKQQVAFK